ncbi:MAG: hypothetical protein A2756_02540 [Candidatus Ryanbacteria bacterium RIFCSPHIGHO2_01_FULL_48_27]|uniref:CARDB domain-containing protein n=1 Tax=Candidatus Ryanbacteria bacterium RIFCSPHIGHO2_01_FULL_48_27 TaxID=1802115 RepID=A0A1G2G693_9BACT|nr:MAG: hypothetical protein A2756_02540 [Candidatus Ryanbacteria bacterium RIFCSPHIGHO2_01_FULL_48_27]
MYIDNPIRMRRFQFVSLFFGGVVMLYSVAFFAGASTACKMYYNSTVPVPDGFGAAYSPFISGTGLELDCAGGVVTLSLGHDSGIWTIVYEKGYKYVTSGTPHWQEFILNGERVAAGSPWIKKRASAVLSASILNPGKNFVVAYECTKVDSGYRCGCRDHTCSTSYWQLQVFDAPTGTPPPSTGSADLMLDAIKRTPTDATIPKGTLMSFTGTVANHGTGVAVASQTRLFIDGTAISPDQTTGALAAEGSETETWTNAWTATEGAHKFQICADGGSVVSESIESNNCTTSASFTVSVTAPPPVPTTGFWDEGFKRGVVRSDLGDIKDITMGSCLYNDFGSQCKVDACAKCQTSGAKNYSRSNFYSSVTPAPADSFWVLDHNDDSGGLGGAFSNSCHSGPPNQSFPVGSIGSNSVFGFGLEDIAGGKRVRLALKNKYNACGNNAIPYLGIGAQKDRGNNGKNIGSFVKGKTGLRVNFTASLNACDKRADGVGSPCLIHLDIITRWNGKPRQLLMYLAHQNHPGTPRGAHLHWNWPNANSYFYPGSDIVYLNCEEVGVPCLVRGQTKNFSIDVDKMLINASNRRLYDDKIPEGVEIPIEGIHWSIETAGPSAGMEATVSNMTTQVLTY